MEEERFIVKLSKIVYRESVWVLFVCFFFLDLKKWFFLYTFQGRRSGLGDQVCFSKSSPAEPLQSGDCRTLVSAWQGLGVPELLF